MNILISESQFDRLLEQGNLWSKLGKKIGQSVQGSTTSKSVGSTINFDKALKTVNNIKPKWDYDKIKISDNLELIRNPKGGGMKYKNSTIKKVQNINTNEYVDLKWSEDEFGVYYYMSAQMKSPVDAGRAMDVLKKEIPSGSRFGESSSGSLSTDSFYSMLRRLKDFTPKVVGYVKLNDSGVKRFQEFIKNTVPKQYHNDGLLFKSIEDAKPLLGALNSEIKKSGLNVMAKISKNKENDLYNIIIPNIHLYIK